jgi:hypothetical protein
VTDRNIRRTAIAFVGTSGLAGIAAGAALHSALWMIVGGWLCFATAVSLTDHQT